MKKVFLISILILFYSNQISAQQKQHQHKNSHTFVDNNNDGYNDNAPDHDGDGIPNGLDPDWTKRLGKNVKFIDLNGDGINDLINNNLKVETQDADSSNNVSNTPVLDDNQ